jgi:DME family drug/metabolite transporter
MISIVLALISALTYGLGAVLARKRLDESNFISVSLTITVIGNIILWPLALLFTNLRTVNLEGALFFVIAGILAPGVTRLLYYKGMEFVGVSINASIFAINPMFSSILAFLLLGEILAPENWIGIMCIVIGVVFIERNISKHEKGRKRILKRDLVFPLIATLTIAFSIIFRKHALNIYNEPLLGVAIGYFSSLLLYLPLTISFHTTQGSRFSGEGFRLFWKAGICLSLGWVLAFYALSYDRVSIVAPLIETVPLFILFFAHLYLREMEHISFNLVISTLLIVIGAVLVSVR